MKEPLHADSGDGNDYTLCGYADEGNPGEDEAPPPEYAKPGETVTCPSCRRIITYCKTFRGFKTPS